MALLELNLSVRPFQWSLNMRSLVQSFLKDETGASAVEYTILVALIGVAIIAAVTGLGNAISKQLNAVAKQI